MGYELRRGTNGEEGYYRLSYSAAKPRCPLCAREEARS